MQSSNLFTKPKDLSSLATWQRMASACGGSIVTSLLLTPLDVIKVRLQVAHTAVIGDHICPTPPHAAVRMYNGLSDFFDFECVRESYGCGCRTTTQLAQSRGTLDAIRILVHNEGPFTLWRGLGHSLVLSVPSVVMYFPAYDEIRFKLLEVLPTTQATVLSAAIARSGVTTIMSPLEMIRTQVQAMNHKPGPLHHMLKDVYQTSGFSSLWSGVRATLWRDIPFSIIYWLGYESTKEYLDSSKFIPTKYGILSPFMAGSAAGIIATIVSHPFDVVKTKIQFSLIDNASSSQRSSVEGTWTAMRLVIESKGAKGLVAGMTPRLWKIVPSCAIMISCYEMGKWYFSRKTKY
eukprot:NODE_2788_length_1493_cov_44.000000_g2408_i0.p1 GENE.NODE_2788_length_1493_cov_44.000000_g2408_i0~~NODE_2788_length_1493_cov_44.000000_g2408_i0.p1  ORF type:complete len:348 (-),score=63.76 NODE_2788_length_1493_cov_44.000000_g2408_i0:319-1362(-)